jgi:hypothetical protein
MSNRKEYVIRVKSIMLQTYIVTGESTEDAVKNIEDGNHEYINHDSNLDEYYDHESVEEITLNE